MGEKIATGEKRKSESPKELLDVIYLTGLGEWSQNEQKEAWGVHNGVHWYLCYE